MPSVVLMVLRAKMVALPVRSGAPDDVPVYVALVVAIFVPVELVHDCVVLALTVVALNVPETGVALLAPPSIPCATAAPAPTTPATAATANTRFLMPDEM